MNDIVITNASKVTSISANMAVRNSQQSFMIIPTDLTTATQLRFGVASFDVINRISGTYDSTSDTWRATSINQGSFIAIRCYYNERFI